MLLARRVPTQTTRALRIFSVSTTRFVARSVIWGQTSSSCTQCVRSISTSKLYNQDVFHAQAEDPQNASILSSLKTSPPVPQTLTEKIVQRYAVGLPEGKFVKSGDVIVISPHRCMTHDNSFPVSRKFLSMGATKIHDPKQIVMTLDHDVQNKSEANLQKYKHIEDFAKKHEVDFYPAGRGIGHQIMVEEGYSWPQTLCVASDSHSNMYGGVSCLGTAVVRTDAASIWATSKTWWQVPKVAKITFKGVLPKGVTGKDVIIALCGLFNQDEVLNHAIEFAGSPETMRSLSIDDRLAIANMTTEYGGLSGLFEIDDMLEAWLRSKATMGAIDQSQGQAAAARFTHARIDELYKNKLSADPGAQYAKYLYLDLNTLSPYVSGPNSVKIATPLDELEAQDIKINKAYLVSCTNSRASDIKAAANVFREAAGRNGGETPKIADGVKLYIAAASMLEQEIAEEQGDWQVLQDAGAHVLVSGCGPCIGLGLGLLEPGEVGISASNRNFKGRMGSTDAKAYLASPEVVAASALSGKISGPGWYKKPEGWTGVVRGEGDGIKEEERMITADEALQKIINQLDGMLEVAEKEFGEETAIGESPASVEVYPGFPERLVGELVFVDGDNINTDGIYPGKYTYVDNISTEMMAEVCMENFDKNFKTIARPGDILVSGFNFGTGSSREQAATSLLAKRLQPVVVAGSFGNIFTRNAVNNGLAFLESPRLIRRLREVFSDQPVPARTEITEPHGNKESQESLDSPPPAAPASPAGKQLTRRTGWKLVWDVRKSQIEVTEGEGGQQWTEKVGDLPSNVQEIIAKGGLEKWVRTQIATA